jgi:hypothetical protein
VELTPKQYAEIAERFWEANQKNAVLIAEAVMKSHSLPPVVSSLPGMPAFLADLEKRSFLWGAIAVLNATYEKLNEIETEINDKQPTIKAN